MWPTWTCKTANQYFTNVLFRIWPHNIVKIIFQTLFWLSSDCAIVSELNVWDKFIWTSSSSSPSALLWIVTSLSPDSPLSSLASPAVPSLLIPRHIWWENPDSRLSLGAVMMIYRDIISLSHQQENQVTTLNLLFYICFIFYPMRTPII